MTMKKYGIFIFAFSLIFQLAADNKTFREENLSFKSDGYELPGTLLMPDAKAPFPLVILVHGSGPNDRNETIFGNTPFKDIAVGLAERGVASYRYDKRTLVYGNKFSQMQNPTVYDETINDAVAAAEFFKNNPDISKIYILGHSLGGTLIPRIDSKCGIAAGYIILAGATRPLEDLILEQTEYIFENDKATNPAIKQLKLTAVKNIVQNIRTLTPDSKKYPGELMGAPASYWLDLKGYEPAKEAKNIAKPLLILQGMRDYQVTIKDFDIWKSELAGKSNVGFRLYPGLNHLFIRGIGKSTPAEYLIKGHVADEVIDDIASFVSEN